MSSVIYPGIRNQKTVYRKTDPTQFVLRKALELFSDDELAALEQEISTFVMREFTTSRLRRLLDISKRIADFSEDPVAVAA
jgi:hypothetical protein